MKYVSIAKVYIILTILLVVDFTLYLSGGISFVGQWADKILFWAWLLLSPITIVKLFKKRWIKWYLGMLLITFTLSLIPMGMPFISAMSFALYFDEEKNSENYTFREGTRSPVAIPHIYILEKNGAFEREVGETDFYISFGGKSYRLEEIDEIHASPFQDSLEVIFKVGEDIKRTKVKLK